MGWRRWASGMGALAGILILAACAGEEAPKAVAPDLSYLPQNSIFVVGVDVTRLRHSPLYQSLDFDEGDQNVWSQLRNLLSTLGVSAEEGVERALFSHRGPGTGPGPWVLLLRGRFDPAVITEKLEKPDARMSTEPYRRWVIHNLVEIPGVGDLSLVIVDTTALALGATSGLRRLLDIRDGTSPSLVANQGMTSAAEGIDPEAQVWALMDTPRVLRVAREHLPGREEEMTLPNLEQFSALRVGRAWGVFSEDLSAVLEVAADTEENAENLAKGFEGLLALGRMGKGKQDPDVAEVLEAVRVSQRRALIQVAMALKGETVRRLRARLTPPAEEELPPGEDLAREEDLPPEE